MSDVVLSEERMSDWMEVYHWGLYFCLAELLFIFQVEMQPVLTHE